MEEDVVEVGNSDEEWELLRFDETDWDALQRQIDMPLSEGHIDHECLDPEYLQATHPEHESVSAPCNPASSSSGVDINNSSVGTEDWNSLLTHAFATSVDMTQHLTLPWEEGIFQDIFGETPRALPSLPNVDGDFTEVTFANNALSEHRPVVEIVPHLEQTKPAYHDAVRSMPDLDYMQDKRCKLNLAVAKWMEILALDWDASSVGMMLRDDLQKDPTGLTSEDTLRACFGVKSPTTLLKRAASLKQYISWFFRRCEERDVHTSPLPILEPVVWDYFQFLRQLRGDRNKGFTVSTTFLETIRFCKFMLGFKHADDIMQSKRLVGFAAIEKREKGPLNQAAPLDTEHILRLHEILEHGSNPTDRMGSGAFLCAIYGRARWSDFRFVHHLKFDASRKNGTLDIFTSEHKTSSVGLKREQFLPIAIPTEGIYPGNWVETFLQVLVNEGFDPERTPYGPLLPAPKVGGGWHVRPLSTSEAAAWLKTLLTGCKNLDKVRAHSMKTTLCVWSSRAGFSKEHRATLSHHSSALHGSDIVYSRELQSGAVRKLQMLLKKVRLGLHPGSKECEEQQRLTATFDSGNMGAVRTPVIDARNPGTPGVLLDLEAGAEEAVETLEGSCSGLKPSAALEPRETDSGMGDKTVKNEIDFGQVCEAEASNLTLHPAEALHQGLIEIDSSSGSSSSSTSSDSEESDEGGVLQKAVSDQLPAETVPEGYCYLIHWKSRLMHKQKGGQSVFVCKAKINSNYRDVGRSFTFRHPRCMKCFVQDSNRIRSVDQAADHIEGAIKRAKH